MAKNRTKEKYERERDLQELREAVNRAKQREEVIDKTLNKEAKKFLYG